MITSIQHFCENGVKNLTDIFKTYTNDLTKDCRNGLWCDK